MVSIRSGEDIELNNRGVKLVLTLYGLYSLVVLVLLFLYRDPVSVPETWKGTAADPTTYMDAAEIEAASLYARIRDLLYFMNTPFQWVVLIIGLIGGYFLKVKERIDKRIGLKAARALVFTFAVFLILQLAELPFNIASYVLSKRIGLSNMSVSFWLTDYAKSALLSFVLMLPLIVIVYFFIKRSPNRWWAWVSAVYAPIIFFMVFIQPVVIDPIFNDFKTLRESETKQEILALAKQAHIPTNQVYEVNMSERTDLINAYVTGIGSNTRIVIWDTTLEKMSLDEIKFIMAHEMGHYVMKHVFWGSCLAVTGSIIVIYLIYVLSQYIIFRWGKRVHVDTIQSIRSLPILLLLLSILTFFSTPIETLISRGTERAADTYALQLTHDADAGITGFKKLAANGKTETNPPAFIKWWRYTHPTMFQRLKHFEEYKRSYNEGQG